QSLNNDGNEIGSLFAASGSTVSGGGTFNGNLSASAGSTIRVGTDGNGVATRYMIDNFDGYTPGHAISVAGPAWSAPRTTTEADIVNIRGTNNALAFGTTAASSFNGVSRVLNSTTSLDNSSTATYFFQINCKVASPNHSLGLGDQANTNTVDFNDYETQLRLQ